MAKKTAKKSSKTTKKSSTKSTKSTATPPDLIINSAENRADSIPGGGEILDDQMQITLANETREAEKKD